MTELLGSQTPVLLDWAVGLNFPCQNHLPTRYGVRLAACRRARSAARRSS
ncbi:arabinosyltransferase C-terminal domain-containing protein [Nocardia cyriacigeorgica]